MKLFSLSKSVIRDETNMKIDLTAAYFTNIYNKAGIRKVKPYKISIHKEMNTYVSVTQCWLISCIKFILYFRMIFIKAFHITSVDLESRIVCAFIETSMLYLFTNIMNGKSSEVCRFYTIYWNL